MTFSQIGTTYKSIFDYGTSYERPQIWLCGTCGAAVITQTWDLHTAWHQTREVTYPSGRETDRQGLTAI